VISRYALENYQFRTNIGFLFIFLRQDQNPAPQVAKTGKPPQMDTLTRIRAFIDVVEAEGFSAAARKVGRSKALLSKYVRELEDDLGALLLNRTTRQFSLTEAGHTYYRTASDILKEIDNLADLVREGRRISRAGSGFRRRGHSWMRPWANR
jgi:DNA-binding transcriptional LysR family regulator